ncbi:hypothetical protein IW261DRAFT_1032832 [Armillaria novae-zelandiae]|uniref:Uncharacterized protein n=1 Tax=Armillaria novae-zelandiae TaxID=153914 RepID=A0AA39UD88_9AGAR|nr:hypothetical protein IW261DRAFT_1032832 [Armillaria novae-zelandiae]
MFLYRPLWTDNMAIARARIYMGCITTSLYIFSMIYVIASWIEFRYAFVFATSLCNRYDLWYSLLSWDVMAVMATAVNLIIADCTIIWRCWVMWNHDWRAIILPILFVIGEIACGISSVVRQFTVSVNDETGKHWAEAIMAATVGTNVLCTTLIVGRIIFLARGNHGVMCGIRTYRGVIEILVESAALYSILYVVLAILYLLNGNGWMYPEASVWPVTGIAPTLIILHVASGHACPEESLHEVQSSLHFQRSRGSTIDTVMDEVEEDAFQGNTGKTVLSGSVEQV